MPMPCIRAVLSTGITYQSKGISIWHFLTLAFLLAFCFATSAQAEDPLKITELRCHGLRDPSGVDDLHPILRWQLEASRTGAMQKAYRILVASAPERLKPGTADCWDSGEVTSATSTGVPYNGKALQSECQYWWKVGVWDEQRGMAWSTPATFLMGKLQESDWQGAWIGPALRRAPLVLVKNVIQPPPEPAPGDLPWHRHGAIAMTRDVVVPRPVKRAVISYAGLGYSDLLIDGRLVGEDIIGPGFREYDVRVPYVTRDVTDHFKKPGKTRIEVVLADGWYSIIKDPWVHGLQKRPYVDLPKLRLDLTLEHTDGTITRLGSDTSWTWSDHPITRSWIPEEDVDLRLADPATRTWKPVIPATPPKGRLQHQVEPPNRILESWTPPAPTWDAKTKTATYQLEREFAGHVRFQARGPAGTVIRITTIPTAKIRRTSTVTLAGTGAKEVYEPRFCHAAMKTVVISGLTENPEVGDLVIQRVGSLRDSIGSFRCSDPFITQMEDAMRRTCIEYTTFLPNDPVREWKAWTQDIQTIFIPSSYMFRETEAQYRRWVEDIFDGQRPSGELPEVAPGSVFDDYNSPWWGGMGIFGAWEWYVTYGDDSILCRHYESMKRYMNYLEGQAAKTGLQDWGLADWYSVEATPRPLVNSAAHVLYATIMARTAKLIGRTGDIPVYQAMAERVKETINRTYLDPVTGIYGEPGWKPRQIVMGSWKMPVPLEKLHEVWWKGDRPCSQTGQVLPLALDLVPQTARTQAEAALLQEIAAHKGHLSTGFVGTSYLLQVLADLDPEVGWNLVTTKEFPSWYSMTIGTGNDLLKETWDGGMALMPAQGGSIGTWCYRILGGIRPDPEVPGYRRVIIKPAFVKALDWVECHHDGPYGRITSSWRRQDGRLDIDVVIPANSIGSIILPGKSPQELPSGHHHLTLAAP